LGKWADKAKPGAAALNNNWDLIDAAITVLQGVAGTVLGKAEQTAVDAVIADLSDLEAEIAAAAYIKADGTVAMAADLDLGGFKGVNAAAGTDPGDLIIRSQLDAAVAAGLGALSGSYAYALVKTAIDLDDAATGETSPKTFIGDTNIAATPSGLHSTSSNKTRFVASQDGFWAFNARVRVEDFGGATLTWWKNGSEAVEGVQPPTLHDVGLTTTLITDTLFIRLTAGDYIELKVYGLTDASGTIKADSSVSMLLLSANAVGGGDLKSDGSVPMVDPFDNGSQQSKNAADATDPTDLTTLQQVEAADADLQTQIDDLSGSVGAGMSGDERIFTGGDQAVSTGGWEVVTDGASAMQLVVASGTKFVVLKGHGTAQMDAAKSVALQLGISVQKNSDAPVIYPGTMCLDPLGYWVNGTVVAEKQLSLTAGTWTFRLVAKKAAGTTFNPSLAKSATLPAYLSYITG
jgi:hypothetical protein